MARRLRHYWSVLSYCCFDFSFMFPFTVTCTDKAALYILLRWCLTSVLDSSVSHYLLFWPLCLILSNFTKPSLSEKRQEVIPLYSALALLCFKISIVETVIGESTQFAFSRPAYAGVTLYPRMNIGDVLPEDKMCFQINWCTKGQLGQLLAVLHLGLFFCQLRWKNIMFLQTVISIDVS